jgi:hypothetical protein
MSKRRASLYALSLAIVSLIAYKTKMGQEEIVLWEAVVGFGFIAATDLLAMVKTWPWRKKNAEAPADE